MVMYEGAPDFPDPDRVWASVARHEVAVLGVSPTLIRALRGHGRGVAGQARPLVAALHRLHGRAVEPRPVRVAHARDRRRRAHRERLGGHGDRHVPPRPVPGRADQGGLARRARRSAWTWTCSTPRAKSVGRGEVGELVCRQPWPGMTRGIWNDPERYLDTYWSTYDGLWRHGDWAQVDEDGQWFLLGRSDDTINVAGKRLGPSEVESILVGHPEGGGVGGRRRARRDEGRGRVVLRGGLRRRARPGRRAVGPRGGRARAARSSRLASSSSTPCPRRAPPRSSAAPCAPWRWARTPATWPRPRTRSPSKGCARRWRGSWPSLGSLTVRLGRVLQPAERVDSKSIQCGFESHRAYCHYPSDAEVILIVCDPPMSTRRSWSSAGGD